MADRSDLSIVVDSPPPRPLLVFDGDCGFCRYWLARWRRLIGDRFDAEPYQTAAARFPALPVSRFRHSVHLIFPDGRVYHGAEAAYRLRALAPGHGGWLAAYQHFPGFRWLADLGYRIIADHRNAAFRVTRWIWGSDPDDDHPVRRTATICLVITLIAVGGLLATRYRRR